ncbi:MAG: flavodoxin family protein [Euryarchaeota archaeon]|nr:flavodoxin family protein [Euryarchaeota archaeon]
MKIVGINGSPRKNGNTYFLLKKTLESSKIENKKIIHLVDYNILPCNACGKCWETKKCPINDDLEKVISEIMNSDAIVIGSPVYYGTISAQLKAFIDRSGELLGARGHPLKGKIGGGISVARRWGHLTTWTMILLYLMEMRMILPGTGWNAATGMKPDDAKKDKEGIERAEELGEAIGNLCRILSRK